MIRRHATALRVILAVVDAASALIALALATTIRFGTAVAFDWQSALVDPIVVFVAVGFGWPAVIWAHGLYRLRARLTLRRDVTDVLRATLTFGAGLLALLYVFKLQDVSRAFLLVLVPLLAIGTIASRLAIHALLTVLRERGRNARYVLVLGATDTSQQFADLLESQPALGLRVIGHLVMGGEQATGLTRPILGTVDELEDVLHGQIVDEVAVCLPLTESSRIDTIVRLCEDEGKIVRVPMFILEHALSAGRVEEFGGLPIYSIVNGPDRFVGLAAKRALDLFGAVAGGLILSPLLIAIVVAIKLYSPGPVIFRQRRVGLHGRPFDVAKFRTMTDGAHDLLPELLHQNEIRGPAFKLTDDPRITRVGRFLRRTSLDELPQLWNVLLGEMSLVGPRPPLPEEVAGYDVWHRRRLSMKPGITGLWQVRARHEPEFDRWVEMDLEYIDGWSFWTDLKIIAQTVPAVISGSGR